MRNEKLRPVVEADQDIHSQQSRKWHTSVA